MNSKQNLFFYNPQANLTLNTLLTSLGEHDSVVVFVPHSHESHPTIETLQRQAPKHTTLYVYELCNDNRSPQNTHKDQAVTLNPNTKIENIDSKRLVELTMNHQQTISLLK